jgi:hypothetical protein
MSEIVQHLSYSSISLYLDCPEAWQRRYIAQEPTRKNTALAFGSAWHGTLERMIQTPQQSTTEIWTEEYNKAFTDDVYLELGETREQHHNEGIRLLSNKDILAAIAAIKPRHDEQGAMIERKIELRVPGVSVPVIGYIDVILDDETPADFKTSARAWSDDKAAGSLQSLFYLAALNQAGFEVNWRFKHYIFTKTKTPQVQVLEHSHKPGELFFLFDLIRRCWDAIQKEAYPLNPTGWRCSEKYCDAWASCRGKYL